MIRVIIIFGHNSTVPRYSFFEFLAYVGWRLFGHATSFEKEDHE